MGHFSSKRALRIQGGGDALVSFHADVDLSFQVDAGSEDGDSAVNRAAFFKQVDRGEYRVVVAP